MGGHKVAARQAIALSPGGVNVFTSREDTNELAIVPRALIWLLN